MESYGVAEVAAVHGLPFVALRVVADTAADAIPSTATLNAMTAQTATCSRAGACWARSCTRGKSRTWSGWAGGPAWPRNSWRR